MALSQQGAHPIRVCTNKSQYTLEEKQTIPWSIKQLLLNLHQFYKE